MPTGNKNTSCFMCQSRERSEWCSLAGDELNLLNRVKVANLYQPSPDYSRLLLLQARLPRASRLSSSLPTAAHR
jgi:hypothetical protein